MEVDDRQTRSGINVFWRGLLYHEIQVYWSSQMLNKVQYGQRPDLSALTVRNAKGSRIFLVFHFPKFIHSCEWPDHLSAVVFLYTTSLILVKFAEVSVRQVLEGIILWPVRDYYVVLLNLSRAKWTLVTLRGILKKLTARLIVSLFFCYRCHTQKSNVGVF